MTGFWGEEEENEDSDVENEFHRGEGKCKEFKRAHMHSRKTIEEKRVQDHIKLYKI